MSYKQNIEEIANLNPDEETCGFLILNQLSEVEVIQAKNTHINKKKYFKISCDEFLKITQEHNVLAIFHSHPSKTEAPSSFDKICAKELCLPFIIYGLKTKKFFLHFPETCDAENIFGRMYVEDLHECTCLVRDYYKQILDIDISGWIKNYCIPREPKKANELLEKVFKKNLIEVNKDPRTHDILVFKFSENRTLHAGVYLGNESFVHQPEGQISSRRFLDGRWQDKIYKIYRHPDFV